MVQGRNGTGYFNFCINSHSYSSLVPYALSQLLWPTPGYSVYFGLPPASWRALMMSRDICTGTALSASPWKHQQGMCLIFSATAFSFPGASLSFGRTTPPQTGTMAAHLSGYFAARLQVPKPPIDRPVR